MYIIVQVRVDKTIIQHIQSFLTKYFSGFKNYPNVLRNVVAYVINVIFPREVTINDHAKECYKPLISYSHLLEHPQLHQLFYLDYRK